METNFRKLGAFHHDRWMANILYYGKMLHFSRQLDYSMCFAAKLHAACCFTRNIVPWLRSPLTLEAAVVNLALHRDLIRSGCLRCGQGCTWRIPVIPHSGVGYARSVLKLLQHRGQRSCSIRTTYGRGDPFS